MATFIPRALPSRALRNNLYEVGAPTVPETRIQAEKKPITGIDANLGARLGIPGPSGEVPGPSGEDTSGYDRDLSSSLTYGSKDSSVDPSDFNFGSHTEKAKQFLENKLGKSIIVKSIHPNVPPQVLGFYQPSAPFGGSSDEVQRQIYLRPDSSYATLFHEAGHAADPLLLGLQERRVSFNPETIRKYRKPEERLNYLFETQAKPTVEAETEAQSFMMRNLPEFSKSNLERSINYQDTANHPWFKEYPASYGAGAVDDFYRAELGNKIQPVVGEDADKGVATRIFNPPDSAALDFALNRNLQEEEEEILDWTRNYVNTRLDQFQDNPTPDAANYWEPLR